REDGQDTTKKHSRGRAQEVQEDTERGAPETRLCDIIGHRGLSHQPTAGVLVRGTELRFQRSKNNRRSRTL
ncbi:hypothetical protein LCGC14_2812360, partial [marine sediment metagenome]